MTKLDELTESFKMKFERFMLGCDSVEELNEWDKDENGEMDVFYENDLLSIIIRLIAVDDSFSAKEVEYLNKAFGFTYTVEELKDVYDTSAEYFGEDFDKNFSAGVDMLERVNAKLAEAYKELVILACDIITESDEYIALSELMEIKKVKELCE